MSAEISLINFMNKKITLLTIFGFFSFAVSNAKAEGFVGVDLLGISAQHQYIGQQERLGGNSLFRVPRDKHNESKNLGLSFSLGSKLYAGEAFFSTEAFYDYLNSRANDFFVGEANLDPTGPTYERDRLLVKQRYGAKFNAGYRIYKNLDIFGTVGLGMVDYAVEYKSENKSIKSHDIAPIFGAGFIYDITKTVSVKAAYDYQSLKMRYVVPGPRDNLKLQTVRVGLLYYF